MGALSMIGVPAVAGFTGKWYLVKGARGRNGTVLVVLLTSTVLNVAYFLPIIFRAYFKNRRKTVVHNVKEGAFVRCGANNGLRRR